MYGCRKSVPKVSYEERNSRISFAFGILFILYICLAIGIAYLVENWMPAPLTIEDESNNQDRFIAEKAQIYLKGLTDFGPRVAGSYENEVLAVNYLEGIIQNIIAGKNEVQLIEYDIGTVTGSYYLGYKPYGSINAYANLQNVVIKVHGNNSLNSVLINSHFDTVIGSPGGSDDGINCAVMLEVLRKISQSAEQPTNNLIFLLNGGEESNIQASHGFITQHKWAQNIGVVINLEATGADGKEILFQAGPEQAWLMKYYSRVPYPFAHVLGEEIFKSNIIPSDSDFRIFRDFGDVIGYDFAYIKDGYRYHTKYDGFDNIKLGRYQRTGDNILKLVRELANAPEVANPKGNGGGAVYFDVIGLFMVHYEEKVEIIINVITILMSIGLFSWSLYDFRIGCSSSSVLYLALRLSSILIGWIISIIAMALIALFLGGINRTMSWYKTPILIIGLYSSITLIFTHSTSMIFDKFIKKDKMPLVQDVLIQLHLIRIIWTTIMLIAVGLGIKSVYVFLSPVLFNILFMVIIHIFKLYRFRYIWILVYLLGEFIPTVMLGALAYNVLSLFIPICGRFGSNLNPEFMIGAFTVAVTILITSYYMPLFSLLSKQSYILILLAALFFATVIIILTPIGFPYSGDVNHPTPQRFPVFHTQRTYHNEQGDILKSDSGFYFRNMDYNSPRSIRNYVSGMENITSLKEDCITALFCGLPVTYSRDFEELEDNSWIPSEAPIFNTALPTLTLDRIDVISSSIRRYHFTAAGPDTIDVYLSPKEGINVVNISLNSFVPTEQPIWNNRPTIYILYVNGKENVPLHFYVDFEVPENWDGLILDIAIAGKYIHQNVNVLTAEFENFLASFPEWSVLTTVALAHYESWIY